MTERPSLGVGLMSGTSLDGMDAALTRFTGPTHVELLGFATRPYSDTERNAIRAGDERRSRTQRLRPPQRRAHERLSLIHI